MKTAHYINRKETRRYLLCAAEALRKSCNFTKVSTSLLDELEEDYKRMLRELVKRHPCNGRTIREK